MNAVEILYVGVWCGVSGVVVGVCLCDGDGICVCVGGGGGRSQCLGQQIEQTVDWERIWNHSLTHCPSVRVLRDLSVKNHL